MKRFVNVFGKELEVMTKGEHVSDCHLNWDGVRS